MIDFYPEVPSVFCGPKSAKKTDKISEDDIKALVEQYIKDYASQDMTAEQIQQLFQDNITQIVQQYINNYAAQDITSDQIQKMIEQYISEHITDYQKSSTDSISELKKEIAEQRELIKELQEREVTINNTYVTNEYITQVIQEVTDRLDFIESKWVGFFMRGVHAFANGLPKTIYDVEGDKYVIKQGVRCYKDSVGDIYYAKSIADDGTITWEYTGLSFQKLQNRSQEASER